jgi:signal transduction histidine kinase
VIQPSLRHTGLMSPHSRKLLRHAGMAVLFNSLIAAGITAAVHQSFWVNLLYSQLIGLSIWFLIDAGRFLLHPSGWAGPGAMVWLVLGGTLIGYALGSAVGDMLLGLPPLHALSTSPKGMAGFLIMSLCAAGVGSYYLMTREQLARAQLEREEARAQMSEAQLKLLQSQLDPHMLFNTLANLRALIATDPQRATAMLDRLNDYLRATLTASRSTTHTLATEFERLRDYLELMRMRMGARLEFALELPAELRDVPVPTLLLQPLVENAVLHGLDRKLDGGALSVRAAMQGKRLQLQVLDNGVGLGEGAAKEGFGITQVRERLATSFGARATFSIASHANNTLASIEFPLSTTTV